MLLEHNTENRQNTTFAKDNPSEKEVHLIVLNVHLCTSKLKLI